MKIEAVNPFLFRGSRPEKAEDILTIKNLGVRTVLNLEGGILETLSGNCNWQSQMLISCGIETIRIEMNALFPPAYDDVQFALWVMTNDHFRPVFVHCKEGRDRTGFVVAAYRMMRNGWSLETAVREMELHHFHNYYWYWVPSLKRYEAVKKPQK